MRGCIVSEEDRYEYEEDNRAVLRDEREGLDERADGVVRELVLEDDEPGRLGARDPLLEVRVDLGARRAALLADAPVLGAVGKLSLGFNAR